MRNYRECDQVAEELVELKAPHRQLNMELKALERKEKKSVWYQSKKAGKQGSDDPTLPPTSTCTVLPRTEAHLEL